MPEEASRTCYLPVSSVWRVSWRKGINYIIIIVCIILEFKTPSSESDRMLDPISISGRPL